MEVWCGSLFSHAEPLYALLGRILPSFSYLFLTHLSYLFEVLYKWVVAMKVFLYLFKYTL